MNMSHGHARFGIRHWSPARALALALTLLLLTAGAARTPAQPSAQPATDGSSTDGNQPITRRTFVDLARKVIPSVVTVYVKQDLTKRMTPEQRQQYEQLRQFFNDPILRQLFPQMPEGGGGQGMVVMGAGSGVIVSADGYIVTNWHVVGDKKDQAQIRVVFPDNQELSGKDVKLLESSELMDLALLKVNRSGLQALQLGDSDKVEIGDWVAAVGSPLELAKTITQGIISAKHREFGPGLGNMLQTDAAINPGSSGGALVNLDGELIGINRMIASPQAGQWSGYSFAIPANQVKYFIDQVLKTGHVTFGYIGLYLGGKAQDTPKMREALGLSQDQQGVLVVGVASNSPAAQAGMQEGDFITAVDGQKVTAPGDLVNYVAQRPVGSTIQLSYLRPSEGGAAPKEMTATIHVAERPSEEVLQKSQGQAPSEQQPPQPGMGNNLGVEVEPYQGHGVEGLKVTAVAPNSPADKAGIQPGDVLLKLNWVPLKSPDDLARALKAAPQGKPQPLYFMRKGQKILVPIE